MSHFTLNRQLITGLEHALYNLKVEPGDTDAMIFEKYKMCTHMRHDFLHITVSELLGLRAELGTSTSISERFPGIDFHKYKRLTPDIVFETINRIVIMDVSISLNPEHDLQAKSVKYRPLVDILKTLYKPTEMVFVCVHTNLTNLEEELYKIQQYGFTINKTLVDTFVHHHSKAQKTLAKLRPLIPNHFFHDDAYEFKTTFLPQHEYQERYNQNIHSRLDQEVLFDDETAEAVFMRLYDDVDIKTVLKDGVHHVSKFERAFNELDAIEPRTYCIPKPTFHLLYAPSEPIPECVKRNDFKTDQWNILNILEYVSTVNIQDERLSLLHDLNNQLKGLINDPVERSLFQTGFFTGTYQGDRQLKERHLGIHDIPNDGLNQRKNKENKVSGVSIRKEQLIKCKVDRPYFERSHQLSIGMLSANGKSFLDKSGVQYAKKHPEGRKYSKQSSCDPSHAKEFENFYNLLSDDHKSHIKLDHMWDLPIGADSPAATFLKKQIRSDFRLFHKRVSKTHAFHMSFHTSLAADQLIHYNNLNTKSQSILFVNTGLPNVLHIVQGGTLNRARDIGQPFFSIAITSDERWCNSVYGNVKAFRLPGRPKKFLIVTNWRRLQTHKLTLLRDQYYAAQSTGYDTFARNPRPIQKSTPQDYLKFIYVFKSIVGQATSQRVAEFLMDVRYVAMACFSEFTNVSELISDKFSPHYPNSFSRWIIHQLRNKVIDLTAAYQTADSKKMLTPIFKGKERIQDSLGGKINLPAIWSNYKLNDIQDLYDDLFVYVLTGKEPSSNFHEGIKSLNTILKFQSEYDALPEDQKLGIHTYDTFKEFLLGKKTVGCMYKMCEYSARLAAKNIANPKLVSDLAKVTTCEVLSEIVSTKSCIPEYELEAKEKIEMSRAQLDHLDDLRKEFLDRGVEIIDDHMYIPKKMIDIHPQSVLSSETYTNRAKVHDLCLDFITRFPESSQHTLDVANWNIRDNKNRVEAHICIKAQYGAKREFYVVNFGAKAMVRIYENMFKAIAKQMPQEMISVPGDRKMHSMYQNVNEVLRSGRDTGDSTFFVNGDCTKWSACETMASFWGLVNGFKGILSSQQVAFSKCVLAGWSNKLIEIPKDVQSGTRFITKQTEYMQSGDYIRSTQNFLQGMFNYSSSVKAVCATELAIHMWDRRYSKTRPIFVRHLEHSDDYSLIVRVRDVQDFIDFRIMHRLSQKMHGINDSTKKTNCQQFIMEFISLMSYNGRMSYPNIKKTKEVGINIGGTGYQQDIMNTISRSAEALRLGVPQESCYVLQILQGINIYRKYSLGSRNQSVISSNPFNYPLDLFGLPDCLPIYYLSSVSDPNNYRLLKYSVRASTLLKGLYVLTNKVVDNEECSFGMEMIPTFFRPLYRYYRTSKKLRSIKSKLSVSFDDIQTYKGNFPEYSICKPRETSNFKQWLMFMYYNNSFSTAYAQASRQAIMLRLSHFASGECVQDPMSTKLFTISEFIPYYLRLLEDYSASFDRNQLPNLERIALGSDPVLKGIFSLMDKAIISTSTLTPSPPMIMQLPNNYKFLRLENDLYSVVQYVVNQENFWKDRRFHYGTDSLERDKIKIHTLLGEKLLTASNILLLAKLLKAQKQKRSVGICYGNMSNNPIELCVSTIEQGTFYNTRYRIISAKDFRVVNPLTKEIMYSRSFDKTHNRNSLILEELSIFLHFLVYKLDITSDQAFEVLSMVKESESQLTIPEMLNTMSFDLSSPSDVFHKRMYVFMMSFLCMNNGPLYELVGNAYAVQHKYLNKIDLSNLRRFGIFADDGVTFIFRGTTYLAVRGSKDNLLLICQTTTITQASFCYLIASRLFNMISQSRFEFLIQFNLHNCMPLVPVSLLQEMCNQENALYFHRVNQTIMTSRQPEKAFPIMMKCDIPKLSCNRHLSIPNNPVVEFESLTVHSGKLKLFSLPFWSCGSTSTLVYPETKLLGFNIGLLNTEGLLYNYMHSKVFEYTPDDQQKEQLISYFDKFDYDMSVHGFPKAIDNPDNKPMSLPVNREFTRDELLSMKVTPDIIPLEDTSEPSTAKKLTHMPISWADITDSSEEEHDFFDEMYPEAMITTAPENIHPVTPQVFSGVNVMPTSTTTYQFEANQSLAFGYSFDFTAIKPLDNTSDEEDSQSYCHPGRPGSQSVEPPTITLQHPDISLEDISFDEDGSMGRLIETDASSQTYQSPSSLGFNQSLAMEFSFDFMSIIPMDPNLSEEKVQDKPKVIKRDDPVSQQQIDFSAFKLEENDFDIGEMLLGDEDYIVDIQDPSNQTIPQSIDVSKMVLDMSAITPIDPEMSREEMPKDQMDLTGTAFTWTSDSTRSIEQVRADASFLPSLEFEEMDYSSDELLSDGSSEENAEMLQYMKSYIQLSESRKQSFEGGFTRNYIIGLPSFEMFLMRCWTGFEDGYWANTPDMQFQIIWIIHELNKRGVNLPPSMKLILQYAYREVLTYLGKGLCDNIVLLKGGVGEFIGYRLILRDVFSFFNREIAEMAAEQRNVPASSIALDKEEMYSFEVNRALTDDLLSKQSVRILRTRNILQSTLYDISSMLGIIDMSRKH